MSMDLIVRGGVVVDGTGAAPRAADVAVRGDRIVAVEPLDPSVEAAAEIDARGMVVSPGFIDLHTHSDISLLHDGLGESKLHQGVTTEVVGNCGFSPFPVVPERVAALQELMESIDDAPPTPSWTDFAGYADALDASGLALNVAAFLGHGSLRIAAMGADQRAPQHDELTRMQRLLATSMEQGAVGLSTGLTYVPSGFADGAEIAALGGVVARYAGLYATHARVAAGGTGASIEEALAVGRDSGVAVQYSHLALNDPAEWGRADEMLAYFDRARAEGLDAAFDVYPYDASWSPLTQYLPAWVAAGGVDAMRERLSSRVTFARAEQELAAGWYGGIPWFWDKVLVSSAADERSLVGRTLAELAAEAEQTPAAFTLEACARLGNRIQVVLFYRTEADVEAFLRHPCGVIGSDGIAMPVHQPEKKPHPRSFGCYPRMLERYVEDRALLPLADAVRKMTGAPAERLGLRDRGLLRPGLAADLVVFSPEGVHEGSTYTEPCALPEGIAHVVVNGRAVIRDGVAGAERPGRVLRRGH